MSINAEKSKVFLQIDSIVLFSNTHAILSTIDLYGRNKKKSLGGGGGVDDYSPPLSLQVKFTLGGRVTPASGPG